MACHTACPCLYRIYFCVVIWLVAQYFLHLLLFFPAICNHHSPAIHFWLATYQLRTSDLGCRIKSLKIDSIYNFACHFFYFYLILSQDSTKKNNNKKTIGLLIETPIEMNSAVKSVTKSKWSHSECSTQHDTGLVKDVFISFFLYLFNNEVPETK